MIKSSKADLPMEALTDWTLDKHNHHRTLCLTKSWTLPTFSAAIELFNAIAQLALKQDHHPEILSSHTYLKVRIWTHDVGGLTEKDFELATAIDQLTRTQ
ncbi:4a-hydroxytetrahydrobiopterin dehydratase [Limnohabitans sp.]|uniref:4a-hydroxytetrahydrobiopterin dehydratase n=1 Tax=Limnohabitans sp. TaxID=1907725 RepID=UPI00311E1E02